jgi:hypothetical protein
VRSPFAALVCCMVFCLLLVHTATAGSLLHSVACYAYSWQRM